MLKLDAINQMLSGIGQTPVTSVSSQNPAVLAAVATFARIEKKIQKKGWWFNTDYTLTLSYSAVTSEVIIPSNTLSVEPTDTTLPYIQRGTRLYNYEETTFEIGANVDVTLVQLITFEDLPEVAAEVIASTATYEFVRDMIGDQPKLTRLKDDKDDSMMDLKTEDLKLSNKRVSSNPSVARLLSGIRPVR